MHGDTGIRWKLWSKLEDLDSADDIALTSGTRDQMQRNLRNLDKYSTETGLNISIAKTKLLRLNAVSIEKNVLAQE